MIERIASAYSSYSEATIVTTHEGRWIHVSGQGALDAAGRVTETDFEREAAGCFERVKEVLERAGATMARCRPYHRLLDGSRRLRRIRPRARRRVR
jgi:enamine deaminase RidA (YjgF/YER057c/UK114 family)